MRNLLLSIFFIFFGGLFDDFVEYEPDHGIRGYSSRITREKRTGKTLLFAKFPGRAIATIETTSLQKQNLFLQYITVSLKELFRALNIGAFSGHRFANISPVFVPCYTPTPFAGRAPPAIL